MNINMPNCFSHFAKNTINTKAKPVYFQPFVYILGTNHQISQLKRSNSKGPAPLSKSQVSVNSQKQY